MNCIEIKSPLKGILTPIERVPDQVFATNMLGSGFAIDPTDTTVRSPINGTVVQLHRCNHAITIEDNLKNQILIHIGIDTVSLKGKFFTPKVKLGDTVVQGDKLIEFAPDKIAQENLSLLTVVVLLENTERATELEIFSVGAVVNPTDIVGLISESTSLHDQKNSLTDNKQSFEGQYILKLPNGMHARPAARLAQFCKKMMSDIKVITSDKSADLSSIISVLSLGIEFNQEVLFKISSTQNPKEVFDNLTALLDSIAQEEIKDSKKDKTKINNNDRKSNSNKNHLIGVSSSNGIAIGKVLQLKTQSFNYLELSESPESEISRFNKSIKSVDRSLKDLENKLLEKKENVSKAAIFSAHREILNDKEIIDETIEIINKNKTAEFAWDKVLEHKASLLEDLNNELVAARANDLRDIKNRVLNDLLGLSQQEIKLEKNTIIIAEDLTPSDIIQFDLDKVIGFCTALGGATSHVAILARSMNIPAIAGIDKKALNIENHEDVILYASEGYLEINPTEKNIQEAQDKQKKLNEKLNLALEQTMLEAKTLDNCKILVAANIGGVSDSEKAIELGAEGVGLLRTEFIFLERNKAPSQDEQKEIYQKISQNLGEMPLVLRTLDIGGDKQLSYLPIPPEENPFLGVRGIRLCLKNQSIFKEQIRAVLSVNSKTPIKIMFPMVGNLSELREAKSIVETEREKLNAPKPQIGIMIEVPSAALMAESFAPEVDFFSIGTNDLTQYTLAMDRGHNELASQVDGLHPAVLKLISMTCEAASKNNIWVGVCGGIASEVKAVPVLIGLGVSELSLSIPSIPLIKSTVRKIYKKDCELLKDSFLNAQDGNQVREIVSKHWPDLD